jgi:hypothetical protein
MVAFTFTVTSFPVTMPMWPLSLLAAIFGAAPTLKVLLRVSVSLAKTGVHALILYTIAP